MKLVKLFFFLSLLIVTSCAQPEDDLADESSGFIKLCLVEIDGEFVDVDLTIEPEYLDGGEEGFVENLSKVHYPPEAREQSVEGLVRLTYVITKEGTVKDIVLIENPGTGLGAATLEQFTLITQGVSFSPGVLNKEKVNVMKDAAVRFRLE